MNVFQISFLLIAAIVVATYLIDRFTGRKLTLAIMQWHPALVALAALAKAIATVLPSSEFATVSLVLDAASKAAQEAEKLYHINELPKEERNGYAQLLIADTLKQAGVNVTEQIQEIIDGCIAIVCMLMPHSIKPEDTQNCPSEDVDIAIS